MSNTSRQPKALAAMSVSRALITAGSPGITERATTYLLQADENRGSRQQQLQAVDV
jgi:hypothetical protein